MHKVGGHLSAICMCSICQTAQSWNESVIVNPKLPDMAPSDQVDIHGLYDDQTHTTLCSFGHVVNVSLCNRTIHISIIPLAGSIDEAVLQC